MLNTQELANFISGKLNEISSQQGFDYVFDLGAEVLENANDGHIKGILRTVSNNPMVIKDFVSAKIQYRVEFSIPVGRASKKLINIEQIIGSFVATYEDDEVAFTSGKASFEFTYAYAKDFSTQHGTGDTVPLGFDVVVNYTDTGLLGSSKVWMLDGVVIPYQTEAILLEKDGQTNRISDEYYNKSIMLAQTKFYKFTIPYDANSTVCTKLQGDLLVGDYSKTYTLSYYDGVNYTSTAPYTTTVSIFRSGQANSDGGSISMFDITFADVSANEDISTAKYTIELFSTKFDEKNVRFFDGVEQQAQWYDAIENPYHAPKRQIKAPTLNSLITTTQVYDNDGSYYSQIQLANMNIARINEKKEPCLLKTGSILKSGSVIKAGSTGYTTDTTLTTDMVLVSNMSLAVGSTIASGSTIAVGSFVEGDIYSTTTVTNHAIEITLGDTEYTLSFTQETKYSGTITGTDSSSIEFEVVNSTPIVIDGVTYFLSVDGQGNYALVDGGGEAITITDNQFVLNGIYYFVETDNYYQIVDKNQNVIVQLTKFSPVRIENINLPKPGTIQFYDNLTLNGVYNENGIINYTISNLSVSATLNKRNLTKTEQPFENSKYFWVETIEEETTDPETQEPILTTTYNVIANNRPYYGTLNTDYFEISSLGGTFVIGSLTYTLVAPSLITASNGTSYNLLIPEADYYEFMLNTDKYYMDTTPDNPALGTQSGCLTFYDEDYVVAYLPTEITSSQTFQINGVEFSLVIQGNSKKIYKNDVVYADLSQLPYFEVPITYTISTNSITLIDFGVVIGGGSTYVLQTASSPYSYQFTIEGIVYYILKHNNLYDVYDANDQAIKKNIQNGGTFKISAGAYNYYYYTIESADLGANNQVILTLKLDTAQTFLVNPSVEFSECFLEKAHLNRFIDNGDGTVSFNGGVESPLFEREDVKNVAKRLVSRKVLKYDYKKNDEIEQWINNNIIGWIYGFLPGPSLKLYETFVASANHYQEVADENGVKNVKYYTYDGGFVDGQLICLATPVYKADKKIIVRSPNYERALCLTTESINEFMLGSRDSQTNTSIFYSMKYSKKPPFDMDNIQDLNFSIDERGNLNIEEYRVITGELYSDSYFICVDTLNACCPVKSNINISGLLLRQGVFHCKKMKSNNILDDETLLNSLTFPKSHANYLEKTFYKIEAQNLSITVPQTFILPRPGVNVEEISFTASYRDFSPQTYEKTFVFENKKGTYNIRSAGVVGYMGNDYTVKIKDSNIIFTINALPFWIPAIGEWIGISFNYRVYGVVGANKNPIYNPKLLNSDYRTLRLTNERGSQFDYDIQKLNTEILETEIDEQMTPDIQRTYFRVRNTDGVYQQECEQNLTGLVESADVSLPIVSSYMKQMLAEQPNYFNQRNLSNIEGTVNAGLGGAMTGTLHGIVGGKSTGPFGMIAGGIVGAAAYLIPALLNQALSDDNMKKHADIIQNANGNVIFNLGYTTPGPTIEQHALLPSEERIINDQMFANGYTYNRIDQIRNFLHTRKYFNSIKAQIEAISGVAMSNAIKDDLKERLANGLRLWHTDDIQYDLENYELWLEEE